MSSRHGYPTLRLSPIAASVFLLWHAGAAAANAMLPDPEAANSLVPQAFAYADFAASPIAPAPSGTTHVVTNCLDFGTGSLRDAIGSASSGDTIDLTTLLCTRITLTTGDIVIAQNTLVINGPGADALSIDGDFSAGHHNRIFTHAGTGTLNITGLTLTDAKYIGSTFAGGGCVLSSGTVVLDSSTLTNCAVKSQGTGTAFGGAVSANKGLFLVHSKVSGNFAVSPNAALAVGGGVDVYGGLHMEYSTVSDNSVGGSLNARGGGVRSSNGDLYMLGSTVSGNAAVFEGGMQITDYTGPHAIRIINSTISENYASIQVGGLGLAAPATISNSTIAFNHSRGSFYGAGLQFLNAQGPALTLQSTLIANNYNDDGEPSDSAIAASAVLSGGNNLITSQSGPVPAGTLTACPMIGPLGNQGGETQTHRLLLGSAAIDAGNDVAGAPYDQRGVGYPRTHGAQADIGAFEDQGVTPNVIFIGGFEGRCR